MKLKLKYLAVTSALFIALSFCFERPAHAYVDPGSSLLVFQSIQRHYHRCFVLLPPPPEVPVLQKLSRLHARLSGK